MIRLSQYLLVIVVVLVSGCASQMEPTRYYDLTSKTAESGQALREDVTLGIGPVSLPQVLDRPGIVTRHDGTGVGVASYHIWAGELEPAFTRVLADSISTNLQHGSVWASPWDNRFRPEYQVRVFVDRFSGTLNGLVSLHLTWSLLSDSGQTVISTQRYRETIKSGSGYSGYVTALNQLLAGFAAQVSLSLVEQLSTHETGVKKND